MSHISSLNLLRFTNLGQSSAGYNLQYKADTSYVIGLCFYHTDRLVITHEMRKFS